MINEDIINRHSSFQDPEPCRVLARLLAKCFPDMDIIESTCLFYALQAYGFEGPGVNLNDPNTSGSDLGRWDAAVIVAALSEVEPDPVVWDTSAGGMCTPAEFDSRWHPFMQRLLAVPGLRVTGYTAPRA